MITFFGNRSAQEPFGIKDSQKFYYCASKLGYDIIRHQRFGTEEIEKLIRENIPNINKPDEILTASEEAAIIDPAEEHRRFKVTQKESSTEQTVVLIANILQGCYTLKKIAIEKD